MRHVEKHASSLFFRYNTALGPPYMVLVDTNFINFSIRNKIDLVQGMMDCLYAKCTPCITDCGEWGRGGAGGRGSGRGGASGRGGGAAKGGTAGGGVLTGPGVGPCPQ